MHSIASLPSDAVEKEAGETGVDGERGMESEAAIH
jgi:hypothetical protein